MTLAIHTAVGQLPAIRLCAPDGAEATVTLYGAHLVSWKGADGKERLFCSAKSALDASRAIRGGVPVIFPQFAEQGSGMRHGFARVSNWRLEDSGLEDGAAWASFGLALGDLPTTIADAWPHQFMLCLRVAVRDNTLAMELTVRNLGAAPFPFAAALHTYHLVPDVCEVRIEGVSSDEISMVEKLDKIYPGVSGRATMATSEGSMVIEQTGFTDAVVWNPGQVDAAALSDMENDEYKRFVCIEPALLDPFMLEPGEAWTGTYRVS
ncbi:aldose epimerase family protein [Telluria aromaticivorans]|uniref:Putative glucose-6-phosphate 1-epimerase n=1 Tax=Telluria aromaticivorans TaxID=2725995 RepID=A0A7Y2JYR6_9BURK|nr:D-hexose-6-phosphate mutarotase [Telluria aromaticivorans]NNG23020.1 D-hexose-6-phosphate mutarotase [Telluria aromaticivorans]